MITDGRGSERNALAENEGMRTEQGFSTGSFPNALPPSDKPKFESTAEIVAAARKEARSRQSGVRVSQDRTDKTSRDLAIIVAKERNPPRAVEQVSQLLKQLHQDKNKVFIPLQAESLNHGQAMIFKETKNPKEVEPGNVVFTQQGFLKVAKDRNHLSEFVSKEDFIEDGV